MSWTRSIHSTPPTDFLMIRFNIILPSTLMSYNWPLSLGFPLENPVCTSPVPHMCNLSRPSHPSWLITRVIFDEVYRSLSSSLCTVLQFPVTPKYLPQRPNLGHSQPVLLPHCERPSFTHVIQKNKIIVMCILIFIFLGNKPDDRSFWTEWQQTFPEFSLFLISPWIRF